MSLIFWILKPFKNKLKKYINDYILTNYMVFGTNGKLEIHETAFTGNTLFNLSSGNIVVKENVFFGHNVSCITGTHDYTLKGKNRKDNYPPTGRDIVIEDGVWIGSNVTILGPCKIGMNSVIAAMSLVNKDVPPNVVYAGIPARLIKTIN